MSIGGTTRYWMNQKLGHVLDRETWTQREWTRAVEPDTAEGEGSEDADVDVDGAGDAADGFPSLAASLSDRIRV